VDGRTSAAPWQDFDLVMAAARYAADVHRYDLRKATEIPYLSHLWSVAALVLEHGGDDRQVAAALLHDVAEDHGGEARLNEIRREFGQDVAELVEGLSDTLAEVKEPWRPRKQSARCILADLRVVGPSLWERFTVSNPEDQLWYYEGLADALRGNGHDAVVGELDRTIEAIRALV
jgi:(p)ppGpp synthase/HD superfamily hydrolase